MVKIHYDECYGSGDVLVTNKCGNPECDLNCKCDDSAVSNTTFGPGFSVDTEGFVQVGAVATKMRRDIRVETTYPGDLYYDGLNIKELRRTHPELWEPIDLVNYRYAEDRIVGELNKRINKSYGAHYASDDVQCFDAWLALGEATSTFRNTALKYLWRYGKKNGTNVEDLYKAMHYIVLTIYSDHFYKKEQKNAD